MKILIIDDEKNMRHMLRALLSKRAFDITCVSNGFDGLDKLQTQVFDFILCDIRMPEMDGLEFLDRAKDIVSGGTTIIMMSAYGSIDLAIDAMKRGAYDFISKPFKVDEVLLTLKKAEEREKLKKENSCLREELKKKQNGDTFGGMIGESKIMQSFFSMANKMSKYNATVLVTGESGTGKEMVAKGVHLNSLRSKNSFIAVNCGAIPEALLESELFGYSKGAFTGADVNKKGVIASANKGTLFLDEIGELSRSMQVKLLRFLQEGEVRPIGSSEIIPLDVRIVAATSRDLEAEVAEGRFRKDLYFRLNILRLHIPSLRERKDDIPVLCNFLLKKYCVSMGCPLCVFEKTALNSLINYDFPGNVRELENLIQRSLIVAENNVIKLENIPSYEIEGAKSSSDMFDKIDSLKIGQKKMTKILIEKVMLKTNGNKSQAARILEISYPSLLNKIKEHGIVCK